MRCHYAVIRLVGSSRWLVGSLVYPVPLLTVWLESISSPFKQESSLRGRRPNKSTLEQ